ncbi:MAG: flagellar hook-length control protein FliK [Chloroflexi bacterium]|nr:flagellar hook-length control protein FliK [Chloroflexota bacterium]
MMPINFQQTSKPVLTDGLLVKAQTVDLEAIQTSSFDEILKDEEKKLQEAQEISAPSVAAVLAATQMPLAAEPAPAPEMTAEVGAGKINPQSASARPVTNQPVTNPLPQKAGQVQGKSSAGLTVNNHKPDAVETQRPISEAGGNVAAATENAQQVARAAEQPNAQAASGEFPLPLTSVDSGNEVEKVVMQPASQIKVDGEKLTAEDFRAPVPSLKIDGSQNQAPANIREGVKEVPLEGVAKPQPASVPPAVVQEGLSASQLQRADEKKEVEGKQEVDPRAVAIGLSKESLVVKDAGKLSATQVDTALVADVLQQITSQMKVKIKSGNSSMRLQLNPKDLGAIDVQMVRNPQGVSVTFFAEQAATGQLLETQLNQLRQSLKDAGVQLAGLNISQYDQPKQEGGFYKQEPHFSQYSQRSAPQTESAGKERERPERVVRSATEVDYLI